MPFVQDRERIRRGRRQVNRPVTQRLSSTIADNIAENPHSVTFTVADAMARCLGVHKNTVFNWRDRDGFPGGKAGPWNLREVVQWWRGDQDDNDDAARKLKAEADDKEFVARTRKAKLDALEGRLVDRVAFESLVIQAILAARKELLKIPHDMQTYFPESLRQDLRDEVQRRIDFALDRLANWKPRGEIAVPEIAEPEEPAE